MATRGFAVDVTNIDGINICFAGSGRRWGHPSVRQWPTSPWGAPGPHGSHLAQQLGHLPNLD
eukprot:7418312-Alexandrium_andersonii.AAC.1